MSGEKVFSSILLWGIFLALLLIYSGCAQAPVAGTFGYDVERLQKLEGLELLKAGDAMIAVSGPYQARVFTSTSAGLQGRSYGWINWAHVEGGNPQGQIAYLGGESRLWFAPEFGPYSLFFDPKKAQIDENMKASADLYDKQFKEIARSPRSITFGGEMKLRNAAATTFKLAIKRRIRLLTKQEIENSLALQLSDEASFVAFSVATTAENIDTIALKKESGLIAIWELGCMLTSADNLVILPLRSATASLTAYFTPIGERIKIKDKVAYYKADALGLNKIGIRPQDCTGVMGSYSPSQQLLNIVTFNFDNDSLYVNSVPKNTTPYSGDVVNIFNGEVNQRLGRNWPFYEFESSSSAKELQIAEQLHHRQTTYHFEGEIAVLDEIAKAVLGVSLQELPSF